MSKRDETGKSPLGTVSFRRSVIADVSWLFAAAMMAVMAVVFLWQSFSEDFGQAGVAPWPFYLVIAPLSVGMLSLAGLIFRRHVLITNPVLILDDQHITNRMKGYQLAWEDVQGVRSFDARNYTFLVLEVDRARFVSGRWRRLKAAVWWLQSLARKPGLVIDLRLLAEDEAEVTAAVERYVTRYAAKPLATPLKS